MDQKFLKEKFDKMLEEDCGKGDITSSFVPEKKNARVMITSKSDGVLSGIHEVSLLFHQHNVKVLRKAKDGSKIKKGQAILEAKGNPKDTLMLERTALNLLSRMSGISTMTQEMLKRARKNNRSIRIASTRKTAPLLSYFDKKAVKMGGGDTHRLGLYDMVLIKDNHLKLFQGSITKALKTARKNTSFAHKIGIEVTNQRDALAAAKSGADIIMLDNFTPRQIENTIKKLEKSGLRDKTIIEASGGINQENIERYAATGVDVISLGVLTHSVKALDFSLNFI